MNPELAQPAPNAKKPPVEDPSHAWNNAPEEQTAAEVQANLTPEQRALNHDGLQRAKAKIANMSDTQQV